MNIDIKRFALLTSAIAASITVVATAATGCSSTQAVSDKTDSGGDDDDTTSSSSGSSDGGSSSGGRDGGGSSSGDGGGSSSSGDAGNDAGTCLTGGMVVDDPAAFCAVVADSITCSGDPYYVGLCVGPVQNFIPAVARSAVECIKSSPVCESDPTDACLPAAIAEACEDASAETFCEDLAAENGCDAAPSGGSPYTVAECVAIAKALSTTGRQALGDCFAMFVGAGTTCDDATVGSCFTAIPYSYGFLN